MAEQKKATSTETKTQEQTVRVSENGNLIVERETFVNRKDKREMYGYFVRGQARGREIRADFVADDQGGYDVLDMIFSIKDTAELLITENEMTNDDGTKMAYTTYEVQNVDELGIVYKYKIKPARNSDKSYLNVILQIHELEKAQKAKES